MSGQTPAEIEAQIARTRAELKLTVDELSDRLDPRTQAHRLTDETKVAVADIKRRVTGEVRTPADPEPTKTGWIVLGVGAALVVGLVSKIVRR